MGTTQESMVEVTKQLAQQLAVSQDALKTALAQNATLLAIIAKQGGVAPAGTAAESKKDEKPKHKCKHCKKMVTHAEDDCFTLEKNKDKVPAWFRKEKK